jgi:hypothetical protein
MYLVRRFPFLVFFFAVLCLSYLFFQKQQLNYLSIASFDDCMGSKDSTKNEQLRKCTLQGKIFVKEIASKISEPSQQLIQDAKESAMNNTYYLAGQKILFSEGRASFLEKKSTRTSTTTLTLTEMAIYKDLNNDKIPDFIFILKEETNQTNVRYYLSGAIGLHEGYSGSTIIPLGESDTVPTIDTKESTLVVTYSPSIERHFVLSDTLIIETQ